MVPEILIFTKERIPMDEFTPSLLEELDAIIRTHNQMKYYYFFQPPLYASQRRAFEAFNTHSEITWTEGGHRYTAETVCTCSAKNVYYKGIFTKDGKKTTIKAVENSYERMVSEI